MTARAVDFRASDYAVSRPWLAMRVEERSAGYVSRSGVYTHPLGLVDVYQSLDHKGRAATSLRFVHGGRSHNRSWDRFWTDRGISRRCRELIEAVAEGGRP